MPKIIENPREIIIEHARKILAEEGYGELSIRKVAKSCGIATGTIYNYFSTKADLLVEIMVEHWQECSRRIDEIDAEEKDFFYKLRAIYNVLEGFVETFRGVWMEMYSEKDRGYLEKGRLKQHDSIDMLIDKISVIIEENLQRNPENFNIPVAAHEFSLFLVQNIVMMIHAKDISYDSFEKIMVKLTVPGSHFSV